MVLFGQSTERGGGGGAGSGSRLGRTSDRAVTGGRVERSGLAWLHENEVVVAADGARAEISLLQEDLGAEIRITLPVVVHIADRGSTHDLDAIIDTTLRRLREAIEAQSVT